MPGLLQWGIAEAALLCSVDNQSVDRAYRIGQSADVVVCLMEPCWASTGTC